MKKRSVLYSPRLSELKRKRYRVLINKILLFVILILIVLAGIGFLSRWSKLNIQNVQVEGNKLVETGMIESVVRENIAGYYLWLFPKTNFLIYPKNKIKASLADKSKRLKDISIEVVDIQTLKVSVDERVPLYIWCGDELIVSDSNIEENECYFLDESGYIFDIAPYFSGEVYFKFFGKVERKDDSSDSPLGAYFSPNAFQNILTFRNNLESIGVKPASFVLKEAGDAEFYLSSNVPPPNAPKIIFKDNADFNLLTENLQAALATEPLKTDFVKKQSSLLYLDLRFGNKVYFNFK